MVSVVVGQMWTAASRAWMCAQIGWRVIPIIAKTKIPAVKNWPTVATTSPDVIDEWFNWSRVGCDVGVVTGPESGIFVVDIDVHWCNGFVSVKSLWNANGETRVPRTFRVKTPSGGEQWYFRYPTEGKVRNISSKSTAHGPLGAGLDVRGWHGQVVAPLGLGRDIVSDTPVIEAPEWLVKIVTSEPPKSTVVTNTGSVESALGLLHRMAEHLARESTGRNDTLNTLAFKLGMLGGRGLLDESDARAALYEACTRNGAIGDGPDAWRNGEGQFDATFSSGWSAGVIKGETE